MPALAVTRARQTGKSTLAEHLVQGHRSYRSLDDCDVLDAARRDPEALVGGTGPVTLDEVQRAPDLLHAMKQAIDRDREPGRFLLAGGDNNAEDWRSLASRGGFPTPAVDLVTAAERAIWFDGYTRTYLERDLQDLATISALPDFRRLMRATCLRLGQITNQTELGRDVALPQPTVHRWLNLLETSYLLLRLPAYAVNRTKRLIKAPKIYWGDTGIALHLAGVEPGGAHLENLVHNDLVAWRDARVERAELGYWRTTIGEEVDFVVETGGKLLPIEVKATAKPRLADCVHLRTFRAEYGALSRCGLLLHTGTTLDWLAPDVLAVPWWKML